MMARQNRESRSGFAGLPRPAHRDGKRLRGKGRQFEYSIPVGGRVQRRVSAARSGSNVSQFHDSSRQCLALRVAHRTLKRGDVGLGDRARPSCWTCSSDYHQCEYSSPGGESAAPGARAPPWHRRHFSFIHSIPPTSGSAPSLSRWYPGSGTDGCLSLRSDRAASRRARSSSVWRQRPQPKVIVRRRFRFFPPLIFRGNLHFVQTLYSATSWRASGLLTSRADAVLIPTPCRARGTLSPRFPLPKFLPWPAPFVPLPPAGVAALATFLKEPGGLGHLPIVDLAFPRSLTSGGPRARLR